MKVKTFTGTHRLAVDREVNDWLAISDDYFTISIFNPTDTTSLTLRGKSFNFHILQLPTFPSHGACECSRQSLEPGTLIHPIAGGPRPDFYLI